MNLQHEFEYYLRVELPWKLHLSPSKQVACDLVFYHFSDVVKKIATKSPDEFEEFFQAFKEHIEKISKWKCPKGHVIALRPANDDNGDPIHPKRKNRRCVYDIYEKAECKIS